jgi:hypothetical protein
MQKTLFHCGRKRDEVSVAEVSKIDAIVVLG